MNVRWTQGVAAAVLLSSLLGCSSSFDVRRGFLTLALGGPTNGAPALRWGTVDGRPAALGYSTSTQGRVNGKWVVVRQLPDRQADRRYLQGSPLADLGGRGSPGTAALRYDAPLVTAVAIQGSLAGDLSIVDDWVRRPSQMLRTLLPGAPRAPGDSLKRPRHLQAQAIAGPEPSMRYLWVSDLQGGTIWLRTTQRTGTVHINGFASGVWPSQSPISFGLGWIWLSSVANERGYEPDPAAYLRLTSTLEAATVRNVGFL